MSPEITLEFDWSSDYLRMVSAPVFRNGWLYRATLHRDESPCRPDWDYGPLVFYIDRWGASMLSGTDPGNITAAVDRWRHNSDLLERWLRAFHGAEAYWFSACQGEDVVAIVTEQMWRDWGNEGEMPTGVAREQSVEWQAYIEGDVYIIEIERTDSLCTCDECDPTWESLDTVGGHYGDEWAKQAALDLLAAHLPKEDDQWGSSAA